MRISTALLAAALAGCFLSANLSARGDDPPVLRAGIAKIDITPTKPVLLDGYEKRDKLSEGVHDPLGARAIAFEQGGKRLVLVSLDNLGLYHGSHFMLVQSILSDCHLQPSELFLAAIHTHSAPTLRWAGNKAHPNNSEYVEALQPQLIQLVQKALANLKPVEIGVGSGSCPVGVNRREFVRSPTGKVTVELGRNPSVMTDREVQVIKVAAAGKSTPLAVLFDYATHSTALGPRNYLISGDVHGLAEQFVEKQLEGVVAPAFAGASANIDPWYRVLPNFNAEKGRIPEPILMGQMLGEEVVHVYNKIEKLSAAGPIKTAFKVIGLPAKQQGPRRMSPIGENLDAKLPVVVARIGQIAFVGLGGEVFNEIGKEIKDASPFPCTVVITHCNGAAGYLPTKEAFTDGGYEVVSSAFGPTAGDELVKETLRMLREL